MAASTSTVTNRGMALEQAIKWVNGEPRKVCVDRSPELGE
jgi:hypothetical protein